MKLVVASMNRDKLAELSALLGLPGVDLISLRDVAGAVAPEENGATLLDNARIKAGSAVRLTGLPAIADDTGLEVDALGGEPGVRSARFAGPEARYADNVALLLERLAQVPDGRRTARFRTVCVVLTPDGREAVGEGLLEGWITRAPRGDGGFGYDPVFELPGTGRTLAQYSAAEKNDRSHRALAVRSLRGSLVGLLAGGTRA